MAVALAWALVVLLFSLSCHCTSSSALNCSDLSAKAERSYSLADSWCVFVQWNETYSATVRTHGNLRLAHDSPPPIGIRVLSLLNPSISVLSSANDSAFLGAASCARQWSQYNGGDFVVDNDANEQSSIQSACNWTTTKQTIVAVKPLSSCASSSSIDSDDCGATMDAEQLLVVGEVWTDSEQSLSYELLFIVQTAHRLQFSVKLQPQIPVQRSLDNLSDFSSSLSSAQANTAFLRVSHESAESTFGFGLQYTRWDARGFRIPILVREQGVGRGLEPLTSYLNANKSQEGGSPVTTYGAVPYFLTSKWRAMLLNNSEYSVFDFTGMQPPTPTHSLSNLVKFNTPNAAPETFPVIISVAALSIDGWLFFSDSAASLLSEYTELSGRMRPLPAWATKGAVVGMQGGTERVMDIYWLLRNHSTPMSAFWLQDWVGSALLPWGQGLQWNWRVNEQLYPNFTQLIQFLRSQDALDIRTLIYINPMLRPLTDGSNSSLYAEALAKDYFVRLTDKSVWNGYANASLIDFTNPRAANWYEQIIMENLLALGVSGWMGDFGEALPFNSSMYDGNTDPAQLHNRYPEVWQNIQNQAIQKYAASHSQSESDVVYFTRSAFTRTPGLAPLLWLGDQLTSWDTFDGLASVVIGMLSSGLSGFSLSHSDIGGYTAEISVSPPFNIYRTKQLFLRWCELSAMTVWYRTHDGNLPKVNWQFYSDEETIIHFTRMAQLYAAWADYRNTLMLEAQQFGWPIVRPMFFHYPSDQRSYALVTQYLVGQEFLFAPVLIEDAEDVEVYFPEHSGVWTHVWTLKTFDAGEQGLNIHMHCPIGQPALFFRTGSEIGLNFIKQLRDRGLRSQSI